MDKAKAVGRPEGPPHNHVAAPRQATEFQSCYETRETNKGKLKACTDYVHDLQRRLLDKGRQLTTSQEECQEAEQALSQTRAKLTQHLDQVTGCQKRIQDLADRIVSIRANTQSMIMKLAEDFDKQLAEVHAEISTIISQFPSPPGTPEPPSINWEEESTLPQPKQMELGPIKPKIEKSASRSKATSEGSTPQSDTTPEKLTPEEESALEEVLEEHIPDDHPPVENYKTRHENPIEINYNEESSTADINQEPVMPTDKAWQDILRDLSDAIQPMTPADKPCQNVSRGPTETTKTKQELSKRKAKKVDVRLNQQAPETITRIRRQKVPKASRMPHIISILKKTHITEPAPPTTEVRENGQAGSSDESSTTQHLVEDTESEASDWTEFAPTLKEVIAPPNSTSEEATDPTNDVIVRDDETQKTYVKL